MGNAGIAIGSAVPAFFMSKRNAEDQASQRLENRRTMNLADAFSMLSDLRKQGYTEDNPAVSQITNYISQLENYSPRGPRIPSLAGTAGGPTQPPGQVGTGSKGKKGKTSEIGGGLGGMLKNMFAPAKFQPLPTLDLSSIKMGPPPSEKEKTRVGEITKDLSSVYEPTKGFTPAPAPYELFKGGKEMLNVPPGPPSTEEVGKRMRTPEKAREYMELGTLKEGGGPAAQQGFYDFTKGAIEPPKPTKPVIRWETDNKGNVTKFVSDGATGQTISVEDLGQHGKAILNKLTYKPTGDGFYHGFGTDEQSNPIDIKTQTPNNQPPPSFGIVQIEGEGGPEIATFNRRSGKVKGTGVNPAQKTTAISMDYRMWKSNDVAARNEATNRITGSFNAELYDQALKRIYGDDAKVQEHKDYASGKKKFSGSKMQASHGPTQPPGAKGKPLDAQTAAKYLEQAGGDKDKARKLARADGYTF